VPDVAAHLVRAGVLPPEAAARALAAAHDGDVASAALRLGLAQEAALARALADLHGCPAVDFSKSVVPTQNLDVIAPAFCRQRRVLPVSVARSELVLAMADPEDHALADEVRFVTGRTVLRYAAVSAAVERTLDALLRERARGGRTWRGPQAPALPDPGAAWVGVVHGRRAEAGIDLPEATGSMVLVGLADAIESTPFSAPSPARRERPRAAVPPPVPAAPPGDVTLRLEGVGAGRLALVADAAPEPREEAAALLGRIGCTVLQAANGRAALELTRDARPDLVLCDAMLPMMPGFEVCRAVKGDPVLRSTGVVLTSGIHRGLAPADVRAAFGADAFLEKPFRADEVLRCAKLLIMGAAGAAGAADPAEAAARAGAEVGWRQGATLLRAGRVDEAVATLREAAAKDDLSAEAHYYLGVALARQGLLFEAAAAFARAAELRPDVDAAHQVLAQVYEQLGFMTSARQAWARAIETCRDERRKGDMQVRLMQLLGM
jgi:CheY-like chemotaxis protein